MNVSGNNNSTILVLDDDPSVREVIKTRLERAGYLVITAGSYHQLTQVMVNCDAVLCDIILPGEDGLQALKWIREHYPNTPVIMMTGRPTYETAAEAIRAGAYDYLAKPIHKDELLHTIERAVQHRLLVLEKQRLQTENQAYQLQLEQRVAEQTEALRQSEQFLTTLSNTIPDAIFSLKMPGYHIEYANQAVAQIFGYQPQELIGQTIHHLFVDSSHFNTFDQKQSLAATIGQSQLRIEQTMRKKDGQSVWTEMMATLVKTNHQVSQIIAVVRDITQRSFLLGVVAHELRSPLGLLNGFSVAMLDDLENIDHAGLITYLNIISNSATRMLKLVDELLDITKIELGEVPLNIETVNLNQLLQAHVADYTYVARKKNISLDKNFWAEPLICQCDPTKIGQVISNFIDNAIKYSPPNTAIQIISQMRGSNIWVGVKDQGPGIKPDETQHLFKSFGHNKISSQPTAGEKSSGLGLAICKKIIEAHHGEIGVDSAWGQGSTFWFLLQIDKPATPK